MPHSPIQSLEQALHWCKHHLEVEPAAHLTLSWQRRLIEATAWVAEERFVLMAHQARASGSKMAFPIEGHGDTQLRLEFDFRPPLTPTTRMTSVAWSGPSSQQDGNYVTINVPWEALGFPEPLNGAWKRGWLDAALPACIPAGRLLKPSGKGLAEALEATFDSEEAALVAWRSELLADRLTNAWGEGSKPRPGPRF